VAGVELITFITTGTAIGLPVAPDEVMITWPVYWPTARVPALTETETLPGVVPLAGVAVSHVPPAGTVEEVTVKLSDDGDPVTAIVWAGGALPPVI
jgi:hypothetical protein